MNDDNQMQPHFASHQPARIAEPPTSVGETNPGVAVNFDIAEDQLTRFMTRAMTLQPSSPPKVGSFVNCAARFNGTGSNQELQNFILNITLYKDAERINDDLALHELPLLLEGDAATWWSSVKENIYSWPTAMKMMQKTFSLKKPAHQIYTELFATKQDAYIPTEMFIRQKQALLAELPRPHPEDVQVDMIYSLLKSKIQKKVPRNSVTSLDQLINAANCVEHSKNNKRMRKFINFDFEAMRPGSKSKERCSHCRKSKRSGQMGNREMDCYKCNSRRPKRSSKDLKPETINPVYAPLQGFDPNINPFSK